MKVRIAKTFDFDAAHFLPWVADGHKCKRMHGHTYRVELVLEGFPTAGMVVDYAEIAAAWQPLHNILDHRVLNEIDGLENPTTEVLAPFILTWLETAMPSLPLFSVRVYESNSTYCEVFA